ncbi:hypothetical protein Tco_0238070 [Tanacetum coccineum]
MHKRFKRTPSFRYLDILSNSNFFQAFSASSNVPAITCQQEIDFCRVKPRHPVLQMLWGSSLKLMLMHDRDCYGRKVEKESHFSRLVEKMLKLNKNLFSRRGDDPDLELANEDGVWKRIRKGGRRKKKRTTDQFILVRRDQTRMITTGLFQPEMTHQKSDHESSFNHLTQTRIESETEALLPKDLEPMQEDQMDSNSGKLHVSLLTKTETWMMHLATALPKDIIRILCAAGPELSRIKNLENGPKRLLNQKGTRSTDKVDLEEFDLKSSLFKHMNKNKSANRNPANYHLYHALMEALIADEDAMDKEVAFKVKDHKRKNDSDDDEGPLAGSN